MKNFLLNITFLTLTICSFSQTDNDGFYFDGVNDFINVGGASNTNISNINSTTTNNRTYETWFKAAEVTTRQFIMKEGAGTRAVIIYIEGGYLVVGGYNRADYTPRWEGTYFRKAITADTWYHVALVLDDAQAANNTTNPMGANQNTALKFYLDGTLIGENSGYQFGPHNTVRLGYKDTSVRFPSITAAGWTNQLDSDYFYSPSGLTSYSGTNYFEGYLWGFRLWNRVRTPQEIDDYKSDIITTVGTDDLVAILDGDTFTYLANDNVSTNEATVSPVATIIWSATAASTDWNTGSNWVGGVVPDILTKEAVEIQASTNYPIITSGTHIVAGDLQVNASASITVLSGGTLEVSYDIVNNGTIDVKESGSLVLREKKVLGGTGDYIVERNTPTYNGNDFYSYWSSPVVSADSNIATVFPDAELIYAFEASSSNSDWVFHGTSNFEKGMGYAVQNEGIGGQLRTFTGVVNSGDISVNVYNTSNLSGSDNDGDTWSTNGDNLVGNPYPAAIDWDLVITDPDNTEILGTIYLWNQATAEVGENNVSDYLQYNLTGGVTNTATGNIGTGQGFFVRAISNSSIKFKTTHQIASSNTQFYKSNHRKILEEKKDRSWIKFTRGNQTNTLLIGFLEGATEGVDRIYDAGFDTNQKSLGFYSLINNSIKASIQGLPVLQNDEEIVPLGFIVDKVGEYSIGIQEETINDDYTVYLFDKELDLLFNLEEGDYNFSIETLGENNERFEIKYSKASKEETTLSTEVVENIDDTLNLYVNSNRELIIKKNTQEEIKNIQVYNLQGRFISVFKSEDLKSVSNYSKGVYFVKVTFSDKQEFRKKILIY
ncbi:T9SS type A sorting domain-containing protein [Polaribacter sp. KT 15]|uniref:T9SS type A sorting domain-containing protein n=1 Tax=Polaribacter sp. KT 15 TaxID=1896175 RepID=UPI00090C5FFC|nr:T9SS type A sorting domain-containing protein [Polaribacter sp. KT 15]SHM98838.1 Por secretion system C-terminal sorting domain-containing protein [Polaribacter sp. KT 15]